MTTTFGSLIEEFFRAHLTRQQDASPRTIASYSDCIRLLIGYACKQLQVPVDQLQLEALDDNLILDFLDHLETVRHNAPNTRNQRLTVIKTFFRFLALHAPTLIAVCERVCNIKARKTQLKPVRSLELAEVQAIIAATAPQTLTGARDRALMLMLYNTGARAQELVDLQFSDLHLQPPTQTILTGKGRKQRLVPLWDETVEALQHYRALRQHHKLDHPRVFLNARAQPLSRFGLRHLVRKYTARAARQCPSLQNAPVSPHSFRHTTALHLIQAGVDITVVKSWLGHASIKTTSLYLDINPEIKRQAIEQYPAPESAPGSEKPEWYQPEILRFLQGLARVSHYVK